MKRLARLAASDGLLVGVMVLAQLTLFAAATARRHGDFVLGDNFYYESPAWNLASGHGYTLETNVADDPWLTAAYRAAHPADAASRFVPSTTFAPGYGLFLAAIYKVAGHRPLVAVLANGALLALLVVLLWRVVRQFLAGTLSRLVAAAAIATFPGWAFAASIVLSDVLHATLMAAFALLFFVERPSLRRSLIAGVVLGAAIMVRPYPLPLPVALFLWWLVVRRAPALAPRVLLPMALVAWSFVGVWTLRNYDAFHKVIPLSSIGLGRGLWQATFRTSWWQDAGVDPAMMAEERRMHDDGVGDWHFHAESAKTQRYAMERIRAAPASYALACAGRVVRLWVSAVAEGIPRLLLRAYAALQFLQLALLVVGVLLAWRTEKPALLGAVVLTLFYWASFVPFAGESRVMLPVRGLGLALGAFAVGELWRRRVAAQKETRHGSTP